MAEKLEFERKFLLLKQPVLKADIISRIEQHYTNTGRIRRISIEGKKDTFQHTIKKSIRPGVNSEIEKEIDLETYYELIEKSKYRLIKNRHQYLIKNGVWEIDIFDGCNLIIAEVECRSEKELVEIKIPKFIKDIIISEVTNINGFSSKSIAKKITKN